MFRTISMLLLLGALAAPSSAQVYRCRTADGQMVFTDDPANFPPGCRQVQETEESGGGISFVPSAPAPTVSPVPSPASPPPTRGGEGREGFSSLRDEAASLAREYREVVANRITSLPPAEVQQARERTVEIIRRRDELLGRLEAADLSRDEKAEISGLLAPISAD